MANVTINLTMGGCPAAFAEQITAAAEKCRAEDKKQELHYVSMDGSRLEFVIWPFSAGTEHPPFVVVNSEPDK
jgi:hypothetical protein